VSWAAPTLIALSLLSGTGLSARLRPVRAVEKEPVQIVVEVDDPGRAVGAVRIEIRTSTGGWTAANAQLDDIEGFWRARFAPTQVPPAGKELAFRATILGARGGLLLDLGFDEPMTVPVETAEVAAVEDRVLRQTTQASASPLDRMVAYIGAEGRLGSGARARICLSVGIAISIRQELMLGLAVGPAFSRPIAVADGGPIVLGFEGGWRVFAIEPRFATAAPYLELGAQVDLRLPGVDPGLAARVGASFDLGLDTRADLSIGGGPVLFGGSDAGFVGGLRLALRFAGEYEDEKR